MQSIVKILTVFVLSLCLKFSLKHEMRRLTHYLMNIFKMTVTL